MGDQEPAVHAKGLALVGASMTDLRRTRRREMKMKSRVTGQPISDVRVRVCFIVIQDQMKITVARAAGGESPELFRVAGELPLELT